MLWDQPKACTGNWWKSYKIYHTFGPWVYFNDPLLWISMKFTENLPYIYCNWVIQVSPCWFICLYVGFIYVGLPRRRNRTNGGHETERTGIACLTTLTWQFVLGWFRIIFVAGPYLWKISNLTHILSDGWQKPPVIHMVWWSLLVSQSKCGICKPEPSGFVMDFFWRSFRSRCTKQVNLACDSLTSIEQYKGWSPV